METTVNRMKKQKGSMSEEADNSWRHQRKPHRSKHSTREINYGKKQLVPGDVGTFMMKMIVHE